LLLLSVKFTVIGIQPPQDKGEAMKSTDQIAMAVNGTIGMLALQEPAVVDGYSVSARQLYEGVKALRQLEQPLDRAFTLLAGFSLECALKAHLVTYGITEKQLSNRPYGHDLCELWRKASETRLILPLTPPQWVSDLNTLHHINRHDDDINTRDYSKYLGRYPIGIHGTGWPNPDHVVAGIQDVLNTLISST
jgi:hypothetical protein